MPTVFAAPPPLCSVPPSYELFAAIQVCVQSFCEFKKTDAQPPTWDIPQESGTSKSISSNPRTFKLFDSHGFLDTACRFHSMYAAMPVPAASVLDVLRGFGARIRSVRAELQLDQQVRRPHRMHAY